MTMRAVELVIDWEEERVWWTFFEGEEALDNVEDFHVGEVDRGDYPPPRYKRVVVRNKEAADAMGDLRVARLFGKVTT